MEPPKVYYAKEDFYETHTGNKVCNRSLIRGSSNILLNGKCIICPGAVIRADLAKIVLGKYVIIREDVVVRPSYKRAKGQLRYIALHIGENVFIDRGSIVCAARIGNNVHIGANCVISHRCVLKDNVRILDNSVLSPDTEVPPFTVFGGCPAEYLMEMPETTPFMHKEFVTNFYQRFLPKPPA